MVRLTFSWTGLASPFTTLVLDSQLPSGRCLSSSSSSFFFSFFLGGGIFIIIYSLILFWGGGGVVPVAPSNKDSACLFVALIWRGCRSHLFNGSTIKTPSYLSWKSEDLSEPSAKEVLAEVFTQRRIGKIFHAATLHKPHVATHTEQAFIAVNIQAWKIIT